MGFATWRDNAAAGSIDTDNFGNRKVGGVMGLLNPLLGGDNTGVVDKFDQTSKTRAGRQAVEQSGYGDKLGLDPDNTTVGAVKAREIEIQENRAADLAQKNLEKSLTLMTKQQQPGLALQEGNLELGRSGQQLQRDKMTQDRDLLAVQLESGRADNAANRLQELRIMQMQSDASDKRYEQDREWYQQDKQQASLQALIAGIASLGSAFAL